MNDTCEGWYQPYCEFHQRDLTKISTIIVSFLVIILTSLMLYGIIWYEHYGADCKRILTNKLVALICWNEILGLSTTFVTDSAIYLFAPLPKSVCLLSGFVRMMLASNILMLFNSIIVAKYIFIFWCQCYKPFFFISELIIWANEQ